MAHEQAREVTIPCPRCGRPFAVAVTRDDGGHAVDVVGWACACDLGEAEYEDLCDAAVAAADANWDALRRQPAPPPAPRPWWRRLLGGE